MINFLTTHSIAIYIAILGFLGGAFLGSEIRLMQVDRLINMCGPYLESIGKI